MKPHLWSNLSADDKLELIKHVKYMFTCSDDYNIDVSNAALDCSPDDTASVSDCFDRVISSMEKAQGS